MVPSSARKKAAFNVVEVHHAHSILRRKPSIHWQNTEAPLYREHSMES
jgi:hypothetical protein